MMSLKEWLVAAALVSALLFTAYNVVDWANKTKTNSGPTRWSQHCINGVEYIYFKEGYSAALATAYDTAGNVKKCSK